MTICPKCAYKRTDKDNSTTPEYECPKCGIIYSKVKQKTPSKRLSPNQANVISPQSGTSALSLEERKKIYEEEKFRIETRAKVEKEQKEIEKQEKKKAQEEKNTKGCLGCLSIIVILFIFSLMLSLCSENTSNYSSSPSYKSYDNDVDSIPGMSDSSLKSSCKEGCAMLFSVGTTDYNNCVYCCTHDCP